jgi:hypothetical protein
MAAMILQRMIADHLTPYFDADARMSISQSTLIGTDQLGTIALRICAAAHPVDGT